MMNDTAELNREDEILIQRIRQLLQQRAFNRQMLQAFTAALEDRRPWELEDLKEAFCTERQYKIIYLPELC